MNEHWATERLEVIRTLMERSAIYRRALAPIMLMLGLLGMGAAVTGFFFRMQTAPQFGFYWLGISVTGLCLAYLLARKQALKDAEPFWSPPTRRVTQALLPPLFAGAVAGLLFSRPLGDDQSYAQWLPVCWMLLYGCAVHAAGFFMVRGIRLFGWVFIFSGCGLAAGLGLNNSNYPLIYGHAIMGFFFGFFHFAYGIYLYFTEPRKSAS
ncbi:MAG: hypothetical protein ACO1QB_15910 [Verrucomicrobiales bacterium]